MVFWYIIFMKTKTIILSVIGIVIIVLVVWMVTQKPQSEQLPIIPESETVIEPEQPAKPSQPAKPENNTSTVKTRVPSKYVCVGEYCDGSMSGDDYKEKYTVVQIPLTTDGGTIGCGAKLFFAPHAVPKTTAVLDATYRLLFDLKPNPEIPADGFRNVVGAYTQLFYDRVTLQNGVAQLYLTGTMYGPGHCAEPELRAQIDQAALQFPTVQKLEVYLNGKIFDWCTMDVSDGEGPCPEQPQLWITEK